MTRQNITAACLLILSFAMAKWAGDYFRPDTAPYWFRFVFPYIIWSVCIFFVMRSLSGSTSSMFSNLGLRANPLSSLAISSLITAPMLVGYASVFSLSEEITFGGVFTSSVAPAFFEEAFYRGFLFAGLMRFGKWHFIPAALASAVMFGIGHWFQGSTLVESVMASLFTGIGGVWFAWMLLKASGNLWLPIFVHLQMNLYWYLWDVDDSAIGGQAANIFRMTTIAVSILVLVFISRQRSPSKVTA